jgi:hypothetical protein
MTYLSRSSNTQCSEKTISWTSFASQHAIYELRDLGTMENVQLRRLFAEYSCKGELLHGSFPVIIHRRSDRDVLGPAINIGGLDIEKLVIFRSERWPEAQIDVEQCRCGLRLPFHGDG